MPAYLSTFLKGLLLGLSIAAPVGPIGVLCIRRTIHNGRWSGFISGLGAATADLFYGIIAAFGITVISDFLVSQQFWLRLLGALFLIYLSFRLFLSKPVEKDITIKKSRLSSDFFSTFFLTLTNPMTVVAFFAIFAALGLSEINQHTFNASLLVIGIFLGSTLWWMLLSEGITLFRHRISQKMLIWVNRIAGLIILGFAIAVFWVLLF